MRPLPSREGRGYLQLEIEPNTAHVYIDDTYQGQVRGWVHQIVPVPPGDHRLELRARGYMPQRFDIRVAEDEVVTLTLSMEPVLDELESDD